MQKNGIKQNILNSIMLHRKKIVQKKTQVRVDQTHFSYLCVHFADVYFYLSSL